MTRICFNERLGVREAEEPCPSASKKHRTVQKMRDRSVGRLVAFIVVSEYRSIHGLPLHAGIKPLDNLPHLQPVLAASQDGFAGSTSLPAQQQELHPLRIVKKKAPQRANHLLINTDGGKVDLG